jgi:hypothetical protein
VTWGASADADVGPLAPTLLVASHPLFAGRSGTPPEAETAGTMVTTVLAGVAREPLPRQPG